MCSLSLNIPGIRCHSRVDRLLYGRFARHIAPLIIVLKLFFVIIVPAFYGSNIFKKIHGHFKLFDIYRLTFKAYLNHVNNDQCQISMPKGHLRMIPMSLGRAFKFCHLAVTHNLFIYYLLKHHTSLHHSEKICTVAIGKTDVCYIDDATDKWYR